jgi:hypothetical protein
MRVALLFIRWRSATLLSCCSALFLLLHASEFGLCFLVTAFQLSHLAGLLLCKDHAFLFALAFAATFCLCFDGLTVGVSTVGISTLALSSLLGFTTSLAFRSSGLPIRINIRACACARNTTRHVFTAGHV